MYLINAETHKLESFFDSKVPKYAILSHTWAEEEVSFKDMMERPAADVKAMKGYMKIQYTCDQALEDKLKYAWVDTCCIDKSSSAELSEAINSMFKWYKDAKICYAYLSDVHFDANCYSGIYRTRLRGDEWYPRVVYTSYDSGIPVTFARPTLDDLERLLRTRCPFFFHSRWFLRGWTLQELIAPSDLLFFDQNWKPIGDRLSLREIVQEITGVDSLVFGWPERLEGCPIAQRMSWAALRQTTRKEDEAYSLFGIFNVNLPLLYGEGEKAFLRLQEAILSRTSDHSILAWDNSETGNTPLRWKSRPNVLNDPSLDVESSSRFSRINRRYSVVLARSISAFRDSGEVKSNTSMQATTTTLRFISTGLKITLPLFDFGFVDLDPPSSPIPMFGAILDCRLHGGWLALKVYQWGTSKDVYRVYQGEGRRLWYVDASIARRAELRDISLWHSFDVDRALHALRDDEPEQLTLLLGDKLIRENLLSVEASFPPDDWQFLYSWYQGQHSQLDSWIRAANFSHVVSSTWNPVYGVVLFRRKHRKFTLRILLRFLWPAKDTPFHRDTARQPVLRLQYWLEDEKLPGDEILPRDGTEQCRCEQKVCPHRLESAPIAEDLSPDNFLPNTVREECHCGRIVCACDFEKGPNNSSTEILSQDSTHVMTRNALLLQEFAGCSHEDTIRLWPSNFTLHASLKSEIILGIEHKILELECVEDESYASSAAEELRMEE